MNVVTGIVVYAMLWWIIFFMALPINIKVSKTEKGHASSAPINPALKKKIVYTSLVTIVVWGLVYWGLEARLIPLDVH